MDDDPHRSAESLPASAPGLSIRFARGLIGTAAAGALTLGLAGWAPVDTVVPVAPPVRPQTQTDEVSTDAEERLGVSAGSTDGGVLVTAVLSGSVAASAGLRAGEVLTAVDGIPVGSLPELGAALAAYAHGDWVTVRSTGADGLPRATVLALA